jgi:hypothetical protein
MEDTMAGTGKALNKCLFSFFLLLERLHRDGAWELPTPPPERKSRFPRLLSLLEQQQVGQVLPGEVCASLGHEDVVCQAGYKPSITAELGWNRVGSRCLKGTNLFIGE